MNAFRAQRIFTLVIALLIFGAPLRAKDRSKPRGPSKPVVSEETEEHEWRRAGDEGDKKIAPCRETLRVTFENGGALLIGSGLKKRSEYRYAVPSSGAFCIGRLNPDQSVGELLSG